MSKYKWKLTFGQSSGQAKGFPKGSSNAAVEPEV